ncbi:MAG: hypothetical protein ACNA8W_02760 [Bradymonadaceae bacterium]
MRSTRLCILPRLLSLILLVCAPASVMLLAPGLAQAQDASARLEAMLDTAIEDYDVLMLEEAEAQLEEAVGLARRENLTGPIVGRVFIMLGIVRYANTRDEGLTEEAFIRALENDTAAAIDPVYATPTLTQILERARPKARPPEPPKADEDAPVVAQSDLEHTPIRRANAGHSILFEAHVTEDLPVFRTFIYHRRFGESEFTKTEMMPTSATRFAFSLEGRFVRTSQVDYYMEAVDRGGKVLANSGRATSPHIIIILGSSDADDTTVVITPPSGGDDPLLEGEPRDGIGIYAFIGAGTDVGFLPGGTSPTANPHREVSPGVAPAFAHSMLDIGYMITPSAHIGLYWRWQFSPDQAFDALPAEHFEGTSGFWDSKDECFGLGLPGDCLLGLKYRWVFAQGTPQFYSSVGGGVGRVRNWLRLKQATSQARPDPACLSADGPRETFTDSTYGEYCYIRDTVRTGWMHFGVGGGLNFPLTGFLDLTADTYLMFLVPDTSINLDLNFGLRIRL